MLHEACHPKGARQAADVREALDWLRPHIYHKRFLDELWDALAMDPEKIGRGPVLTNTYTHIMRQLGMLGD